MSAPEKRQPWMKWYPDNWRAEPRLNMVSRAARSLWLDMLGLMHEAEPRGFLIVASTSLTDAAMIALALGDRAEEIAPLLAELDSRGVFSCVGDGNLPADVAALIPAHVPLGTILSRKMVRDSAKSATDKTNGGKGGNPRLKAGVNPPVIPPVNGGDKAGVKAHIPEARVPEEKETPLRGASGGDKGNGTPEPLSDADWLWKDGLAFLVEKYPTRKSDDLRSLIGKWIAQAKGAALVRATFEAAQRERTPDPLPFIVKGVKARMQAAAPFEPGDSIDWENRFRSFAANGPGSWPPKFGGRYPGDDPRHPAEIIAKVFPNGVPVNGRAAA